MSRPFATIDEPAAAYDAVVVGAGVGGLVCGTLLARAGLKVLLVEQHYMVGGYCSTFRRQGYTFDAATHFYPLLGNPETLSGRLLQELDVHVEWIKMDPVDRFHFPDGSRFEVPADFDCYMGRLKAEFPSEAPALDRFFSLVRAAYLAGVLHFFRRRPNERFERYRSLTVRQVVDDYFTDPKLKLLLTADCPHWGSPPARTSFVFDSMLRLSYFLGNYYPRGGSQAFVDALAVRFTDAGGEILMDTPVNRILRRHGTACGVELLRRPARARQSTRVSADVVVSNADLRQTCEKLVGREAFSDDYLAWLDSLRPSFPCYLLHLGVRDVDTETLREAHGYYWRHWDADRVGRDALTFKIFVPTLHDPSLAPSGRHVIIVQKVLEMDYRSVTDWKTHKAAIEAFAIAHLEKILPELSSRIEVRLSASARTSFRYTLNHEGAMLGWEMAPDQLGSARPDFAMPIRNLFSVGHWTRPGGGITPVIVSAVDVARRITARERGDDADVQHVGVPLAASQR